MRLRPLLAALTAGATLASTAGCAGHPQTLSRTGSDPVRSPRSSGPAAAHPSPEFTSAAAGRSVPPARRSTSAPLPWGTAASSRRSPRLYIADSVIHDGQRSVGYDQAPGSTVTYLTRTVSGWVLKASWSHVGGQVVLVGDDGAVIHTYAFDDVGHRRFDVSDDDTEVALVTAADAVVRVVDARTGRRTRTVRTPLHSLRTVRYSGPDLVISGGAGRTLLADDGNGTVTDLPYAREGRLNLVSDVSSDGEMALVDDSVRRGARPCLSVYPVGLDARPRWRACDVASYEGALSADGSLVITIRGVDDSGYEHFRTDGLGYGPRSFQITDTRSGSQVASIDPPGRLIDAAWTADGHVLVNTGRRTGTFRLHECSLRGDCSEVTGAEHLPGLGRTR